MPRYRLKPKDVEALQFTIEGFDEFVAFCESRVRDLRRPEHNDGRRGWCIFDEVDGESSCSVVNEGDYMIKDRHGWLIHYNKMVFESEYELDA